MSRNIVTQSTLDRYCHNLLDHELLEEMTEDDIIKLLLPATLIELKDISSSKWKLFNFAGIYKLSINESSSNYCLKTMSEESIDPITVNNYGVDSYPYFYIADTYSVANNPPKVGYYKVTADVTPDSNVYVNGVLTNIQYVGTSMPLKQNDIDSAVTTYSGPLLQAPRNMQLYHHLAGIIDASDINYSIISNDNSFSGLMIPNIIGNIPLVENEIFYITNKKELKINYPNTTNKKFVYEWSTTHGVNFKLAWAGNSYHEDDFNQFYKVSSDVLIKDSQYDTIDVIYAKIDGDCPWYLENNPSHSYDSEHDIYVCEPLYIRWDINGDINPSVFHEFTTLSEFNNKYGPIIQLNGKYSSRLSGSSAATRQDYTPTYPTVLI